jgi:3-(3-hydroxy-phenyl)propionate hydroxylase
MPDAPIHDPDRRTVTRLREIVRDGVLAITTTGQDVSSALKNAIDAPSRAVRLETIDDGGVLSAALGARAGEVWLIRPDGHIAAVLADPDSAAIAAAARRMLGIAA